MVSGCADPNSFNNDNVNQLFSFINHSQIFGDISSYLVLSVSISSYVDSEFVIDLRRSSRWTLVYCGA